MMFTGCWQIPEIRDKFLAESRHPAPRTWRSPDNSPPPLGGLQTHPRLRLAGFRQLHVTDVTEVFLSARSDQFSAEIHALVSESRQQFEG